MLTLSQAKEVIEDIGRYGLIELIDQYSEEVIEAALECGIQPSDIRESYQGEFDSDRDFAMEIADQLGAIKNNQEWPYTCIDWDHAAKELMYDYCEDNHHYFRNV
jgi:antirestriction protein